MVHKIKELCKANNLTMSELERISNVSFIRRWDKSEPSVYKVLRVAQALNTTVEDICLGE